LDARVGSHVLIGAAVGAGLWAIFKVVAILVFQTSEPTNSDVSLNPLIGARQWIGAQAGYLNFALRIGLIGFVVISGLRKLLRNDILAAAAAAILATMLEGEVGNSRQSWMSGLRVVSVDAGSIF